jgi:hypothetical protein
LKFFKYNLKCQLPRRSMTFQIVFNFFLTLISEMESVKHVAPLKIHIAGKSKMKQANKARHKMFDLIIKKKSSKKEDQSTMINRIQRSEISL